MIIVAGSLRLDPDDRDAYLAAVSQVAVQARNATGCLDFVQVADPVDLERIHIYERWGSDEDLQRFRSSGGPSIELPPLTSMDVRQYRVASVEEP